MLVRCPHCDDLVVVNGLGRKPLNIPLKNICEALREHGNAVTAANELNCSQGYIFGVLKANGLKLRDVVSSKGLATKEASLLHNGGLNDGR